MGLNSIPQNVLHGSPSSTADEIVRFDGITGKRSQSSATPARITDAGDITMASETYIYANDGRSLMGYVGGVAYYGAAEDRATWLLGWQNAIRMSDGEIDYEALVHAFTSGNVPILRIDNIGVNVDTGDLSLTGGNIILPDNYYLKSASQQLIGYSIDDTQINIGFDAIVQLYSDAGANLFYSGVNLYRSNSHVWINADGSATLGTFSAANGFVFGNPTNNVSYQLQQVGTITTGYTALSSTGAGYVTLVTLPILDNGTTTLRIFGASVLSGDNTNSYSFEKIIRVNRGAGNCTIGTIGTIYSDKTAGAALWDIKFTINGTSIDIQAGITSGSANINWALELKTTFQHT